MDKPQPKLLTVLWRHFLIFALIVVGSCLAIGAVATFIWCLLQLAVLDFSNLPCHQIVSISCLLVVGIGIATCFFGIIVSVCVIPLAMKWIYDNLIPHKRAGSVMSNMV